MTVCLESRGPNPGPHVSEIGALQLSHTSLHVGVEQLKMKAEFQLTGSSHYHGAIWGLDSPISISVVLLWGWEAALEREGPAQSLECPFQEGQSPHL